jgi:transposase
MLSFSPSYIYLYRSPADMRKSFNGLHNLVCEHFPDADFVGSLFVFMNRRQNFLKALYWDEDGFVLWAKKLRQGCFRKLDGDDQKITRRELMMLLEGIAPKRLNKRFTLPKSS